MTSLAETEAAQGAAHPGGYRHFVLAALCLVYTLNFLDRQFLSILAEPVKHALNLSDAQLGLLTGLAFALFYTAFGIPVALLADRAHRITVVSVACFLWSFFSAGCGFASNFATLALARIGVGVGEAGGSPPAYSVISDYFPPERRATALAVYALGVPFGTMFGAASGGWIATHYGWRAAFMGLGAFGLVVAPLVWLTVREPKRGTYDKTPAVPAEPGAWFAAITSFFSRPILYWTAISAGLSSFVGYAMLNWAPAFLIREKAMTLSQIALYYSVVLGVSMAAGTWLSGYLVDRFAVKHPRVYAILPGIAVLVGAPFLIGFVYAPTWPIALVMIVLPSALNIAYLSPALAIVQNAVPARERAVAGSLLLLVLNLIGLGGGPVYVGLISDHLKAQGVQHGLGLALLALMPFCVLAALAQWAASRAMKAPVASATPVQALP